MRIALLGAGFTRNWGGWLASELAGELSGRVEGDQELLRRLKESRNFERVLGELRQEANRGPVQQRRFEVLQQAVLTTFNEMNRVLAAARFEFNMHQERWLVSFLSKFDAIFTLNQDLLLELHYLPGSMPEGQRRWRVASYPGIELPATWLEALPEHRLGSVLSVNASMEHEPNEQPIYKLHGSVNWRAMDGSPIVVIGDGKDASIQENGLLSGYFAKFRDYLSANDTKLMVIGYSFSDDHVNQFITNASENHRLQTYLVNPAGLSVFDSPASVQITAPKEVYKALRLVGISTRPFRDAFASDDLSFNSFQRFLQNGR